MSNCRPEEVSEEAEISSQRESTASVAGVGVGKNMGWFLTSRSGQIPTKVIVISHTNVAGGQGRPPRTGDIVRTGEGAQTLTATGTGASQWVTRDSLVYSCTPLPPSLLS